MTKKLSRKTRNAQSRATCFRHPAVLSLSAVLLRKLPNKREKRVRENTKTLKARENACERVTIGFGCTSD